MLIQLTDFEDGLPCIVQTEAIVHAVVERRQGNKRSTLISFGLDAYVRVRETPEEILELASAAEFEAVYEEESYEREGE